MSPRTRAPRLRRRGRPVVRPGALALVLPALLAVGGPRATLAAQDLPGTEACVDCHRELADSALAAPARLYPTDVHAASGFGCLVCHGGPRTARAALDPATGFLSTPRRQEIPALCGRCHADAAFMRDYNPSIRIDQVPEYYSSVHGRLLQEEDDPDVATCVSCHPAHAIRPPSDPASTVHPLNVEDLCAGCHADEALMGPRGLPTDQLDAYQESVHGRLLHEEGDVSAPTCNDCHGNHGAAPPGLASVHNVCGQCHTVMDEFFEEGEHGPYFEEEGLPGCVTCHDNHAIQAPEHLDLVTRSDSVCAACHGPSDPAGDEFRAMARLVDSLLTARSDAQALLDSAEAMGMHVSEAQFQLQEVDNSLTQARSAVHTFRTDAVAERVAEGMETVADAGARGHEALDEHTFRRVGLAASTAVIVLLILSLLARIRMLDRRVEPTFPGETLPMTDRPDPTRPSSEGGMDRKSFVDWVLGASAAGFTIAVAYPVSQYLVPPESGEAAVGSVSLTLRASDVARNSGHIFKFGNRPGILVRTSSGELRAFSARCTHLDCTVQYREDLGHIWCACHNGHFDLNGSNIAGPPPAPLERYEVNVRGDEIVVSRSS